MNPEDMLFIFSVESELCSRVNRKQRARPYVNNTDRLLALGNMYEVL